MKYIKRKDIQSNPDILFVFGDNDARKGMGGMAKEFRNEPNSIGIRVKKKPARTDDSYYVDEELTENCLKIDEDIEAILEKAKEYVYSPCTQDNCSRGYKRVRNI